MLSANRSFQAQNSTCSTLLQTILLYETCIVVSWKSLSDVRIRKWRQWRRQLHWQLWPFIGKFRFHIYIWYIYIYYLDQKVPGIHSENSKYKFYSSKVIFPFKYSPRLQHTYASAWSSSRNISGTLLSAIRAVFDFSITSFRLLKRVPCNGFLTRLNRKKSQGAISGEFDDILLDDIRFILDKKFIMMAVCDGALSWCKIHELFAHKSFLFWRTVSRKRLITPK